MSITVGHTTFDRVRYDAGADVLYLHVGEPNHAVDALRRGCRAAGVAPNPVP